MPIHLNDVLPPVIVIVYESAAPRDILIVDADAGSKRHITKSPVAIVVVKIARVVGEIRLEDIEPAVAIVIRNAYSHSCLLMAILAVSASGDHRDVSKGAVVVVAKQDARFGIHSHIDVGPTIVVKIRADRRNRIPRSGLQNARFL